MELPKRKHPRIKDYDYTQPGAYFITICTANRQEIFCKIVGRDDRGTPKYIMQLTGEGKIADKYINSIHAHYDNVSVDKYVIMPDHIHILLSITENGVPGSARPTVPQIIAALKRMINKALGTNIFQTSFYDHIIRDENDYRIKWGYIENNPIKWLEKEGEHK